MRHAIESFFVWLAVFSACCLALLPEHKDNIGLGALAGVFSVYVAIAYYEWRADNA